MGILTKWIESLDYDYEILTKCTRHKSPRSTCTSCIDACDRNAISISKGVPVIHSSQCNECGKCIATCPVQAVAGIFPRRSMFQNQLVAIKGHTPAVKELLIYYKKGIKSILCEEEELSKDWQQTINKANRVLQELGEPLFHVQFQKVDQEVEKYTRRDLFFAWKKETQLLMKQMAPAKWRFNQNDLELAKYYPNHQFVEISLDTRKCTLCKACQILCNKKSLAITEESFSISAQTCSACKLCEDICPERAISVEEKIMLHTPLSHPIYKKVCKTCKKGFETVSENDDECVPCVKRKGLMSSS